MSLYLAGSYVAFMSVIYLVFARWYHHRKRNADKSAEIVEWFAPHRERMAFYEAINSPEGSSDMKNLSTLLMRRAITNVLRMWKLHEDRSTLMLLRRNGAIGDDLWNDFQAAEEELNKEVMNSVEDADALREGWGKMLYEQARAMAVRERERMAQARRHGQMGRTGSGQGSGTAAGANASSAPDARNLNNNAPKPLTDEQRRKLANELIAESSQAKSKRTGSTNTRRRAKGGGSSQGEASS